MAGLNFFSLNETEAIRDLLGLSLLEVTALGEWGSDCPQHRELIHHELASRMKKVPRIASSSISHCRSLGGFAVSAGDHNEVLQLGFDIEETARVTAEVAHRICRAELEYKSAPSPASLWTAKEAAFKSVKGPGQPSLVSSLEIANWKILNSQYETASVKDPQNFGCSRIDGVVFRKIPYTFAFFVLRA